MLILLVGKPKTGKTLSACTFPRPTAILNFDNSVESIQHTTDKGGKLLIPDWKDIKVVPFCKDSVYDLDFDSSTKQGAHTPLYAKGSFELVEKYNKVIRELGNTQTVEGFGPLSTLIVDSLTSVVRVWEETILKMNSKAQLSLPDYKTFKSLLFGQFIPSLRTLNKKIPYIILIAHETVEKDELSGRVEELPLGPSQEMGRTLAREFDEVWRMKVDSEGNRVWRTTQDGLFNAGSNLNLPPTISPATFSTIDTILKKRGQ